MNLEKTYNEGGVVSAAEAMGVTEFQMRLGKCYAYANRNESTEFPDEYRVNYEELTQGIERMNCAENVRTVMRLRYRYGHKFVDISRILALTYQWVYSLHNKGVCLLEKHLTV